LTVPVDDQAEKIPLQRRNKRLVGISEPSLQWSSPCLT
jgi:hypothetical protein